MGQLKFGNNTKKILIINVTFLNKGNICDTSQLVLDIILVRVNAPRNSRNLPYNIVSF